MILHFGFQIVEFRLKKVERPGEGVQLRFASKEDALSWLKRLGFLQTNLLVQLRDYVARHLEEPETYRLTNHYALERLANLLYLRRIQAISILHPASAGSPTPVPVPAPAFPLSERSQRDASSTSAPPPAAESPTFVPGVDATTQAGSLVAAAADGKPFCRECAKAQGAAVAAGNA